MILCDFDDLNNEEFHLKFFDTVVQGNIELVKEILQHPKLGKQFDVSYNNYYCIIASIMNAQQINDCHLDLLKLFIESPLLKKHANPLLCSTEDIFGGPLGNAIIFTPVETVRYLGKFFDQQTSNLQDLIALAIFNSKKEAFFYLVEERHFIIAKTDIVLKALLNFPQVDSEIVDYIKKMNTTKSLPNNSQTSYNTQKHSGKNIKNKPVNAQSCMIQISCEQTGYSQHYWGSRFRQNF